ncbi:AAA family ATPase [Mycolicibacterium komossense]|uniref:AAA family ATPase n=1 Tax=Mycolicibacterium komossense TaxID=1779 RepID=A0ABT3CK03_9MYCO|nr:AAA family ATPase [Mycolicibacterium komossense]MCV7229780.1 AAA family ATPase [Mycolicibacterium komossense]
MRLHRLVLTNYRGVTHRDIEFPDHGVTVVSGHNEIGKSSMIEALDLLLESKDRSTKKDVKQVKPTHADVGAEVTAEISTGPYRFVYRKRFHKKCETELTVLAPHREQLTGDEAHDRVRSMLADTVDTGLWQAQRVLQSTSTSAVPLAGCDALSRALDIAAGDAAALAGLSGSEPVLIERIDAEFGRYFTPTGRPTGQWAAAIDSLKAAEADVAQCTAAVAEVDDRIRRHAMATDELAELDAQRDSVAERHTLAVAAAESVAALTDRLQAARTEAGAAEATSAAATAALQERHRLRIDVDARAAVVTSAGVAAREAAEAEGAGRAVVTAADAALAEAVEALRAAEDRLDAARHVVTELSEREEFDRLCARLARIDAAQRDLDQVTGEQAAITLTDKGFRAIEVAASAVDVAAAQVAATSTIVEVTAETELELLVDDRPVVLSEGQVHCLTVAEATALRLPGVLSARVAPSVTAADSHAKLDAAQQHLQDLLVAGGVASAADARLVDERRRELTARRDQLSATLAGIRGDDDIAGLRSRLEVLSAGRTAEPGLWDEVDSAGARAALEVSLAERKRVAAHCETQRKVAAAAAVQLVERGTRATVLREKAAAAADELTAITQRLVDARAIAGDDDLALRAQAAADAARLMGDRVVALSASLEQATPDVVAAELDAARTAAQTLGRRHDEVSRVLRDVTVELTLFGAEGRTGKLDAAQIRREHAAAAYARTRSRAQAAHLLRSVMARHRDNTRLRYVDPFRTEIERLGRAVFGPTFEVEVDSALQIRSRTLDGRTVPYESLSGGAKEQLGLVTRLAVSALVAKEDTVPVVIDDALGFTDPDRLVKMGAVFDLVGSDGQVIVLTCTPERYNGVHGAHRIELSG